MALVAFIGNAMLGNINSTLSPTTATGQQNGSTQNLSSNIVATATRGSGNYSYLWNYSGTVVTFTGQTNSTTNINYASISVAGSSTISCTVTDRTTGVVVNTTNSCVITWPIQSTPITSVTWSIGGATNSTYNGAAQSVTVVSVSPPGATYSTSTTTATNAGSVASTTITGTGSFSGSFTSPNLTIIKASLSVSGFQVNTCLGFSVARMQFSVSGFQGADTGSLTTWIGTSSPTSVAPVSTNDSQDSNAVSQSTNANPIGIGNGFNDSSLYLCSNIDGVQYWVQVSGNATNYNTSGFDGPVDQQCGS